MNSKADLDWLRIIAPEFLGERLAEDHWVRPLEGPAAALRAVEGAWLFGMAGFDDLARSWFRGQSLGRAPVQAQVEALAHFKAFRRHDLFLEANARDLSKLSGSFIVRSVVALAMARSMSEDWVPLLGDPTSERLEDTTYCIAYMRCLAASGRLDQLKVTASAVLDRLGETPPAEISRQLMLVLPWAGMWESANRHAVLFAQAAPASQHGALDLAECFLLTKQFEKARAAAAAVRAHVQSPSLRLRALALEAVATAKQESSPKSALKTLRALVREDPLNMDVVARLRAWFKENPFSRYRLAANTSFAAFVDNARWSGILVAWENEQDSGPPLEENSQGTFGSALR